MMICITVNVFADVYEILNRASEAHAPVPVEGMSGGTEEGEDEQKKLCEHDNQINCDFWERHFTGNL